jgi:hypothetical protein
VDNRGSARGHRRTSRESTLRGARVTHDRGAATTSDGSLDWRHSEHPDRSGKPGPAGHSWSCPLSDSNRRSLPCHRRFRWSRAFTDAHKRARNPCKPRQSRVYGRGQRKTVEVKLVDGKWTEATLHPCRGLPALTRVAARRRPRSARPVRRSLSSATSDLERWRHRARPRTLAGGMVLDLRGSPGRAVPSGVFAKDQATDGAPHGTRVELAAMPDVQGPFQESRVACPPDARPRSRIRHG